MRRVAIFRTNLLALSETFVRDQARALRTWEPVLIGRRELDGGLASPGVARELVPEQYSWLTGVCRFWLWRPDPMLVTRLKKLQVDLVHVHFGLDATDVWPSVRAAGLPMVVTLHGYDINAHRAWWEAGHEGRRQRLYPRRLLKLARDPGVSFIAVSEAIKRRAIAYGIPADKVSVSYIGVDVCRFRPEGLPLARRPKRILFVGRMVEKKSPLLMIRAFGEVRKEMEDAELVMIGDGPLLGAAKTLARELSLPVFFLGAVPSDAVLANLHQARVFCLPSTTAANGDAEGLPIALLEAQACGVPCVTTMHSGNPEAIRDTRSGVLVAENDVPALSAALRFALMDVAFLESARDEARQNVEDLHDLHRTTRDLELIYERMAHERSGCRPFAARTLC